MRSLLDARYVVGHVALLALALTGCDDAPPDEPPLPGGPVTFLRQNVPVTEFVFPATIEQGHASALFVIRNDTDATLASIATTFEGDPSFAIDETMSTCVAGPELVPHDLCTVLVRWTAAATTATAQLVVTSGDVTSSLSIRGPVGVPANVIADTSAIDFGIVPLGSSSSVQISVQTGRRRFRSARAIVCSPWTVVGKSRPTGAATSASSSLRPRPAGSRVRG
jgi:hypothetical protein